jgi:hypothetical protein
MIDWSVVTMDLAGVIPEVEPWSPVSATTPWAPFKSSDGALRGHGGRRSTLPFIKGAGSITVTAEHLAASRAALRSGTPFLTLTEGHGFLTVSSSGVAGSLGGQVALTLPGVALTAGDLANDHRDVGWAVSSRPV